MKRVIFMAYFLKKSKLKKGLYLQIYESFYDPWRKQTAHRSFKALGYVGELQSGGIEDPLAFYAKEVEKLNLEHSMQKTNAKKQMISENSPERFLGYFPLKGINDSLGVKQYLDLKQTTVDFRFNVYDMLSALVYARAICPCSKLKTFEEILPCMYDTHDFSLSQLYSGLEYIGSEYENIIELYNYQMSEKMPFDTSHTYFDCTNFYFEIDREDDLRRKGPSKENRKEPIVGMGLLLDAHQIPIGMKIFPGNASEKPVIREIIDGLKSRNSISGRTIQVADKGLNCSENVLHARQANDGYIFSKSVKQLPETEQTWVLLDNDYVNVTNQKGEVLYRSKSCVDQFPYTYTDETGKKYVVNITEKRVVTYNPQLARKQRLEIDKQVEKAKTLRASQAKRSEYGDSAKYVSFVSTDKKGAETKGKVKVVMNEKAIEKARKLAGYNMLVTSEIKMSDSEIYAAYHNLWRIEESFRIMKSQLDARPVYLQKEDTIKGHFLVCYLAVLLERLFQFKVLENRFCSEDVFGFIKKFKVAKISERKYLNLARKSEFIEELAKMTGLPILMQVLTDGNVKKMLSHRF